MINVSVDYNYCLGKFNFFGEMVVSDNGSIVMLNGLLIGFDFKVDFVFLFCYYFCDYWFINFNVFVEMSGVRNEIGLYIGIVVRLYRDWIIFVYFDVWEYFWICF